MVKALGKPPKHPMTELDGQKLHCTCMECFAHRHIALLEASEELESYSTPNKEYNKWQKQLAKKMRTSAGETK